MLDPAAREGRPGRGAVAVFARIRELVLRNPHYKLLALAMSIVAWSYVQGDEIHETRIKADVVWSLPPDLSTPEQLPSAVTLTVRGTRAATRRARDADVDLPVDLSDIGVGEHALSFDDFTPTNLPAGVEVLSTSPASVRFLLDETASRKVGVQPVLVGQPPEDIIVASVALDPQVVEVVGPRVVVERLREVDTTPIDVSQVREDVRLEVDLDLPRGIRVADASARPTAAIDVEAKHVERDLSVPVVVWGSQDWVARPALVSVTLRGPSSAVGPLTPEDLVVVVYLPQPAERGTYEAPFGPTEGPRMRVLHPGGVDIEVARVGPPRVEVVRR